MHETPWRTWNCEGLLLALGTMDQFVPSHRSTKLWSMPKGLDTVYPPTLRQNVVDVHDTAWSWFSCEALVFGLGTTLHTVAVVAADAV